MVCYAFSQSRYVCCTGCGVGPKNLQWKYMSKHDLFLIIASAFLPKSINFSSWSSSLSLHINSVHPKLNVAFKYYKNKVEGQRQLGLDFTWDNGQLTWINKWLGWTIDQDKKNPLGLTINLDQQLTWIDSQLLQHIYRPITAHLLHYCSMFTTPLQHIYCTIAAHLITAILRNTKFKLSIWEENFYIDVTSLKV